MEQRMKIKITAKQIESKEYWKPKVLNAKG